MLLISILSNVCLIESYRQADNSFYTYILALRIHFSCLNVNEWLNVVRVAVVFSVAIAT